MGLFFYLSICFTVLYCDQHVLFTLISFTLQVGGQRWHDSPKEVIDPLILSNLNP